MLSLRGLNGRAFATAARGARRVVGVRREDKNQWERRTPIAPTNVRSLVSDGIPVLVQTSTRRIFSDAEFEAAGAKIVDDVSSADIVLGVKEVPIGQLVPDKTYLMFSHTHKGQSYNMPMLRAVLDKRVRLIDYELLKDSKNQRLVRFGTFAGYSGKHWQRATSKRHTHTHFCVCANQGSSTFSTAWASACSRSATARRSSTWA